MVVIYRFHCIILPTGTIHLKHGKSRQEVSKTASKPETQDNETSEEISITKQITTKIIGRAVEMIRKIKTFFNIEIHRSDIDHNQCKFYIKWAANNTPIAHKILGYICNQIPGFTCKKVISICFCERQVKHGNLIFITINDKMLTHLPLMPYTWYFPFVGRVSGQVRWLGQAVAHREPARKNLLCNGIHKHNWRQLDITIENMVIFASILRDELQFDIQTSR